MKVPLQLFSQKTPPKEAYQQHQGRCILYVYYVSVELGRNVTWDD